MTEGTHIPGAPACNEWEAQLTDALDGLLSPEQEAQFVAHKMVCPACAEMYEEARKGRQWLEFLSPEPEPPAGLLEKILAATGPGHDVSELPVAADVVPAFIPPVWQQAGFAARMRASMQPRVLMTVAMAFFSITLTLNLTGTDVNRLRLANLRPQMLRSYMERQVNMASVPIVRYYDHLRFVHEVEARVRELRSRNESEDNGIDQPQQTQPATPGETRNNKERGNKGTREQAGPAHRNQSLPDDAIPGENEKAGDRASEFLESSLALPAGPMQSRSYMVRTFERSTPWIA
ncbi:MAG: anti-sigma factor family protein [Terracidiphilus sp.]